MAPLSTLDIYVGLAAIVVAASAIYLFIRASSSSKTEQEPSRSEEDDYIKSLLVEPRGSGSRFSFPTTERHLKKSEVNRAESKIRTLTLQSELLSIVLKRLFEAEDDGEISREERVSLSRGYENDLKRINEELKRAELVVTLHELETIREDILQKFESTLNSTQSRIDTILKELKIEEERPRPPKRVKPAEELEEEEEIPEEEKPRAEKPKSDVEERLEQLRSEVLKELEELDRLELEA